MRGEKMNERDFLIECRKQFKENINFRKAFVDIIKEEVREYMRNKVEEKIGEDVYDLIRDAINAKIEIKISNALLKTNKIIGKNIPNGRKLEKKLKIINKTILNEKFKEYRDKMEKKYDEKMTEDILFLKTKEVKP